MARGKHKLRKGERVAAKTAPMFGSDKPRVPSPDLHDAEHECSGDDCDHSNVSPAKMRRVSALLSDLFTSSFKLAVPSLFRGMVQNLQDQVLKDKLMSFIDHGFSPNLIKNMAGDQSTRDGIKTQIKLACEEELGDVVLRLSTEDAFDLLCDLAVRHGRDLKTWGPPCACSFARCLPCLERLVQSIKFTPPTPPSEIKPIDPSELHRWVEDLIENEWVDERWTSNWKERITSAWEIMAKILWETAVEIDPLLLSKVKEAHDTLTRLDGLDLYYTVVTREVTAMEASKDSVAGLDLGAMTLSGQYERMKRENRKLKGKDGKEGVEERDEMGRDYRRALAKAIREQGNTAYASGAFQEATEYYTRAIGYDATEPIYPLNRAACLLKLKRFPEAERDCTTALLLDPGNHKAFFRRGVSRAGMGHIDEAKQDFEQVLKLQKSNPEAREELRKLSEQFLAEAPAHPAPESTPAQRKPAVDKKGKGKAVPRENTSPTADQRVDSGKPAPGLVRTASDRSEDRADSLEHLAPPQVNASKRSARRSARRTSGAGAGDAETGWSRDVSAGRDKSDAGSDSTCGTLTSSDTVSTRTEGTSSPSPTRRVDALPPSALPVTSDKAAVSSSDSPTGAATPTCNTPQAANILHTDQQRAADEAALQMSFAFVFSQVVAARTGVDVPSQLGLVRSDGKLPLGGGLAGLGPGQAHQPPYNTRTRVAEHEGKTPLDSRLGGLGSTQLEGTYPGMLSQNATEYRRRPQQA